MNGVAVGLAVLTIVVLAATAPDIGLTWDEPAYIAASESYVAWMDAFVGRPRYALSDEGIERYWMLNHEHPPVDKVWSGIIWRATRYVLDDLTAHRLGNMLLAGALTGLLYLMVGRELGHIAGLAAAGSLITMPRFFFHAHLAALDVPAAFATTAVVYTFWRTKKRQGYRWDVWLGVVWGLAMAVKINAIVIPPTLFLWTLLFRRRLYLFRRLVIATLVGLSLPLLIWPWMYRRFVPRLLEYILFITVDHWEIGQWYMGRHHMPPPWHFPFVIILAVVPLSLTILYLVGGVRAATEERLRPVGGLYALCALAPLLVLASGQSMVYDNDRLFVPCFPYLAALAGMGFEWIARGIQRLGQRIGKSGMSSAGTVVLAFVTFVPHTALAWSLYPHLLSYYSEAVGGLRGAARLGMETTYWSETYAAVLPYLNAHAQSGDVVWVQDWSHDVMVYYQLHGQLDSSLRITCPPHAHTVFRDAGMRVYPISIEEADYVVLQHRQTGFGEDVVTWLQAREPVYRLCHRDVPLIEVYVSSSLKETAHSEVERTR